MDIDRELFINEHKDFVYKVALSVCKRKLEWENDDELSIALIAFNKAIDSYDKKRGNFFSYAKMLIKNALIDYFRKSSKLVYVYLDDDELMPVEINTSLDKYEIEEENKNRLQEIMKFTSKLKEYGISFSDLVENSPKHKDTREELLNIAFKISINTELVETILRKKQLPIKQICLLTNKKEKLLEKWRKYLIALILILSDEELVYIRSYLNIKIGDEND